MSGSTIRIEGVSKSFGAVTAVADATLDVRRGELVALLGPSGCGKTTLLRLIAGFERPDAGTLTLDSLVVAGNGAWTPPEKRRVGMVFQDYALFPHLTVTENIGFGVGREARTTRVTELLELVGLAGLGARYPHELSGGQQQRVALARALAPSPSLVLLDEPWSNIDPHLREVLRGEVADILRRLDVTAVLVTHDREEAFSLADRIAVVRDGTVVQEGTPEELYFTPISTWVASFVGAGTLLRGPVSDGLVHTALGRFPATGAADVSAADVLVRPEQLELRPDPSGAGEVVGREFRGHDVLYRVLLDGVELISQRPSNEVVPLGARVTIRLHDVRAPVFDVL